MKNLYTLLLISFITFNGNAQIVNIPDVNLKSKLIAIGVDYNNDGEIQASETLGNTFLDISNANISDLTGIEAFVNLQELNCRNNVILNLDEVGLSNLKKLNCAQNGLSTLNFAELSNLESLDCSLNNFTSLNITELTNLQSLTCYNNQMTSINVSGLTNLKTLNCYNNSMSSIDVTGLTNLRFLDCGNNNINSINVVGLENLIELFCYQNSISSLNLSGLTNLKSLYCGENNLNSLDLSGLTNLTTLYCYENQITSINVSGLTNLNTLYCFENNLNSLDLSGLTNLSLLDCSINSLTSIVTTNLNSLTSLKCNNNQFTDLNLEGITTLINLDCSANSINNLTVSNLINLKKLWCNDNQLSSLNIETLLNLEDLECVNNQLTIIDFGSITKIIRLICYNNQLSNLNNANLTDLCQINVGGNLFTSLDFSNLIQNYPGFSHYYYFYNNPNLVSINIKNGISIDSWWGVSGFNASNCPNLLYICADEMNFNRITISAPSAQTNSYCSFNPGGTYNTITGTFSLDLDSNGCDASDYQFANSKIKIDDVFNLFGATYTNSSGNYNFFTQSGNFTITPEFENPYFTVTPITATLNFATVDGSTQTQNFCVTPNGVHKDVEITMLPFIARPGFDANYQLVYKNKGNQTLSGSVNFAFNDAVLDFVTSNPMLTNQTPNNLNWSYTNLLPFESRTIDFTLNVNSPMETPAVNIGDILNFSASIDPITDDETTVDNTFRLAQTVVGSYDPNDKTCLEGNRIVPEKIGDYLHYLIRFQNSGTAAAENVVIKDVIDTTKFDMSSLQLTSASHPYVSRITGNKIEFIFENIQLPAEIDNEPASHGFVAFKIKTKSDLVIGNQVTNIADIYFDYNFPIVTEPATSTFELQLGITEIENKSVSVFPNPVNDVLNINSKGNITAIQVYDIQGRLIETFMKDEEKVTLNLSNKNSGIYFVKIFTEKGIKVEKVIKE